ncbi:MAG: serine/threonine-protein kinase [Planctomycetota bacterium]
MNDREKTEDRVEELFHAALRLDREEQAAFLERECGGCDSIRDEVISLLSAFEDKPEILNLFARTVWNRLGQEKTEEFADPASTKELPFDRIRGYRLVRKLGEGGMSVVYEAMQEKPSRKVALKLMKHVAYSKVAQARFENEGRMLAGLRHPGIAHVIETGTHTFEGGDIPFLVMEYIPDAQPITRYAHDADLSLKARVEKFIEVCDIVHHGHQKGIIHRDLKPANILIDDEGRVKVIDFGVARATHADVALTRTLTLTGQFIGTLSYMSPEQCCARPGDTDMRSDVYTLGVTLFELLCGRLPYDLGTIGWMEAAEKIRLEPPIRPASIQPGLGQDLETILLRRLRKERTIVTGLCSNSGTTFAVILTER